VTPIELRRPPGRFARVGHRGAPALAPANTLRSLEVAVELGCDMLEFDVLPLAAGTLVLAHSERLREISHGVARGRVRGRPLEWLRRIAPNLATLDEALAFLSGRFPHVGLQIDLKGRGAEAGVAEALRRHGVIERSWISSFDARSLRRMSELEPELPRSYTLPRDRFGGSRRALLPRRLPRLLARARATAATLHHSLASPAAIARAHELDAAVYVWTVDDGALAARLVRAGADGIITNDPRIFTALTT
jgi:glycerophosphoryl diester phosphodiesterase